MSKILLWDTENSSLDADFGTMLCFGYKYLGEARTHVISIRDFPKLFRQDPTNDREIVKAAYDILSQADMWVTWYGARYDVPFVATRLLEHRNELKHVILPPIPHVDGWWIARNKMKLHSNRLASISAFLGLQEKTAIKPPVWRRALSGHFKSLDYVIRHCRQDVIVLEEAYEVIKALHPTHPNVALMESRLGCPTCGKGVLQRRGVMVTLKKRWIRYQCQHCGAWTKEPEKVAGNRGL